MASYSGNLELRFLCSVNAGCPLGIVRALGDSRANLQGLQNLEDTDTFRRIAVLPIEELYQG